MLNVVSNKILLLQDHQGKWKLPGGGLDKGESYVGTATREAWEEMGVDLHLNPHLKVSFDSMYSFIYKREIKNIKLNEEHVKYKYFPLSKLPKNRQPRISKFIELAKELGYI